MFHQKICIAMVVAASSTPGVCLAHHSRAVYDMGKEIVVEGVVVDLAWRNPHIFMTVETEGEGSESSRVEIEVTSASEAKALGLIREAIEPGARVAVRAHPGRGDALTKAVGLDVRTVDGAVYPLNTDARISIPANSVEARGISGHWAPALESFNGLFPALQAWPLTETGRTTVADAIGRLNSSEIAALGICEPFPPPTLSIFPDLRTIEVNDTTIEMRFEGAVGVAMERVVHLNQDNHPDGLVPSLMGHSIGRWEEDTLVIDTVAFMPHPVGALMLPSGPSKHLIERLTLSDDRLSLEYTITLEDPALFPEPFSYKATWDHRPDLEFSGEACDPDVARRPLE